MTPFQTPLPKSCTFIEYGASPPSGPMYTYGCVCRTFVSKVTGLSNGAVLSAFSFAMTVSRNFVLNWVTGASTVFVPSVALNSDTIQVPTGPGAHDGTGKSNVYVDFCAVPDTNWPPLISSLSSAKGTSIGTPRYVPFGPSRRMNRSPPRLVAVWSESVTVHVRVSMAADDRESTCGLLN